MRVRVEAPPGVRVRILIEKDGDGLESPGQISTVVEGTGIVEFLPEPETEQEAFVALPQAHANLKDWLTPALAQARAYAHAKLNWEVALLAGALLVYLLVRVIQLPNFPVYFFTDEAVNTMDAADFIRDGFRGYDHQLFPTYFLNSEKYSLSVSVYAQVLPYLLFGKSVWVTRGVSVLFALLAGLAVGLGFLKVFKKPYAWAAVLLLSATPTWFLHSRTAFETVMATSIFAVFLYFYLRYLTASPRYLYAAVVAGALCFYTYNPMRMVVGVTALLLFISDIKYHWEQRKIVLRGFGLALLFALPLLRFLIAHPNEATNHLTLLDSYWVNNDISLIQKLGLYARQYLNGLSPIFWYSPNVQDISRHLMKGYGRISGYTLPFMIVGLAVALRNIRKPIYRAPLIALLAAPTGAALVEMGVTRALVMVIPVAILTGLGFSAALEWLERRWQLSRLTITLPLFLLMALLSFRMMNDALINGPLWYDDYGLTGLQYGANQIFGEIDDYLATNPDTKLLLSPTWANGTDTVARFYYPDSTPFKMGSINGYFNERLPLDDTMVFVMIPPEYKRVIESDKFTGVQVDRIIPYPDGNPGFYFVRLRYADNIDEILQQEIARRKVLQEKLVPIDGVEAQVDYSYLDMGTIEKLFDSDESTLVRTMEANPFILQVSFPQPKTISSLAIKVGGAPTGILVSVKDAQDNVVWGAETTKEGSPNPRTITLTAPQPIAASAVLIEVRTLDAEEPAHVHVWEVKFNE